MSEDPDKLPPSAPFGGTPSGPSDEPPAPPPAAPSAPSFGDAPFGDPTAPRAAEPAEPPAAPGPAAPAFPPPVSPGAPSSYPPPGPVPPGGAFPPPGGAYPPGPGFTAPGAGGTDEDRTWILIAHFGGGIAAFITLGYLGWLPPVIARAVRGNQSPLVQAHANEALNFQLTWTIASLIGWVLTAVTCGILFFVPLLIMLVPTIFGIIGGVKALNGEPYAYPAKYRFIK
ncbi:MAG: hypothetical protein JWO79_301 [Actinomycetia bacterium]|nr:hypothetical protein [Actinomycetes bacterium]MDQ1658361.1 uncharacterized protein [Cryptosporangiaceae bacterium]